jgi:hypothetical protein
MRQTDEGELALARQLAEQLERIDADTGRTTDQRSQVDADPWPLGPG